jgi:hypothetical protein
MQVMDGFEEKERKMLLRFVRDLRRLVSIPSPNNLSLRD